MRRFALPLFYIALGGALVWVVVRPGRPPAAAPVPVAEFDGPPLDLSREITVRRSLGPTERFKPHSVHVDGRPVFVDRTPIGDAAVTILTLSDGRVQAACTER